MTIAEIKKKVQSSTHPIAKSLHQGTGFKVLMIAFEQGMVLREHKAHIKSKLTVLEGKVVYQEADRTLELAQYEEVDILVEVTHSVKALEDSLCILTQGE